MHYTTQWLEDDRIWFHPPKFWAATRGMSAQEADLVMQQVLMLAEAKDLEALSRFDFITVERRRRQAS